MKEHFIQEITNLKSMVESIATEAEAALAKALEAVSTMNVPLAKEVIGGDYKIDCDEVKVEEECLKILALYQPVASDLRLVITILKINHDLERVADFAVGIARRAIDMANFIDTDIERFDFRKMEETVRGMLKKALQVMKNADPLMAFVIIRQDEVVDAIHRENDVRARELIALYPQQAGYYLDSMNISRSLERVADIATNICEDVIYLESGKIVRHTHNT
ncbi:phosphate signaling complex protein PhoU [Akkermansia glycaniphila]|uniref:Phosphate-specific transport system accessory protein PhoU n=1 Tax=Akkermansia glycaniphila TaxID=1679444 RepID=A0A1C7PDE5_9BACT|nr:phosphate signaling complex protein PhoU [Akkermansia glycaniphila]MBT9448602.1 phosphate signaling complex protein PhoU [Akkermansia glycaniphila]OCA03545.1 hypothetical protein AC781_04130 [Akkermansia glycaniphila]SEH79911.1 phou full: phosphate transport system regulatory protein phou [Akkermansia glycaniphila]